MTACNLKEEQAEEDCIMKRRFLKISAAIALATMLAVPLPASALTVLQSDVFTSSVKSEWQIDANAPTYYKAADGTLRIGVGSSSATIGNSNALNITRGIKMPVTARPSSTTWSAIVKINVDTEWLSTSSTSRRAEFRVDLVDSNGQPVEVSPVIALEKSSRGLPVVRFYNPRLTPAWGIGSTYVDKYGEQQTVDIEEGWHTLLIKSSNGVISYEIDGMRVGGCTTYTTDIYPAYVALGALDRHVKQEFEFDNLYIYDGLYSIRVYTRTELDDREDRLTERYEEKRMRWIENNTQYYINRGTDTNENWKWVNGNSLTQAQKDSAADTRINPDKEMPESYWKY